MKRVTVAALLLAACLPLSARSKANSVRPIVIYSMENCPACEALAHVISSAGARMNVSYTPEARVEEFPTVIYSDGKRDAGARIKSGAVALSGSVRVIKWSGE